MKVTSSHLYVDWRKCSGCMDCVAVCGPKAIEAARAVDAVRAGTPLVVVGSRSEAKALRKRADDAERDAAKQQAAAQRAEKVDHREAARHEAIATDGTAEWTLADAAIAGAVLLGLVFAKDWASALPWVSLLPAEGLVAARVGLLLAFYVIQLAVLVILARRHGLTLRAAFGLGRLHRSAGRVLVTAGLAIALAVVARMATTAFGLAAARGGWAPPQQAVGEFQQIFGAGWAGLVLALVFVAGVGPFVEELVFRGVMLGSLERWGPVLAIVGSAAVFAAYHLALWWAVPSFILGLALGWIAWARRSIWAAIALHAAYNTMAVLAVYLRK